MTDRQHLWGGYGRFAPSVSTRESAATSARNFALTSGFGCDAAPKFVRKDSRRLRPTFVRLGHNSATRPLGLGHSRGLAC